jgi:putative heme-binding domain-containing protein
MNGALALAEHFSASGAGAARTNSSPEGFPTSALSGTNALIRDLLQRFLPPDRRRSTLGTDINPKVLLALRGDATRGRDLFAGASQCARCHTCAGTGRTFGPDLTGIGKKYDRAQLFDHILNPSKLIAPEFKTVSLTMRDGTELSGFVLRRTTTELVLRDETLKEHTLKLSDVREQRESTLSAMPEGLLAPLTAQEAADLLEFLATSNRP